MARRSYRRSSRRSRATSSRSRSYSRGRRASSRNYGGRSRVRRTSSRRGSFGGQTIRLVLEQPGTAELGRAQLGLKPAPAPRRARF